MEKFVQIPFLALSVLLGMAVAPFAQIPAEMEKLLTNYLIWMELSLA